MTKKQELIKILKKRRYVNFDKLAEEIIEFFEPKMPLMFQDLRDVALNVCFNLDIKYENFISKSRKREYVEARQIYCNLAKNKTKRSLSEIGWEMGMRDHSTVLYSIKKYEDLFETDADFRKKCNIFALWQQ